MSTEVSVIVPIFNKAEYLEPCLESIFNQSFEAIEVICINDASSDGSGDILKKFSRIEPRLRIIENSRNLGAAYSRNKGITAASGKFLRFVDADDLLPLDSTQILYESAVKDDVDLVRGSLAIFKDDKPEELQDIIAMPSRKRTTFSQERRLWIPWWHTSYLISADLVHRNFLRYPNLTRGEDPVFMSSVLLKARYISLVEDLVYLYRKYPKTSGSIGSTTKDVRDTFEHAAITKQLLYKHDPIYWDQGYGPYLLEDVRNFLDRCQIDNETWQFVDAKARNIWGCRMTAEIEKWNSLFQREDPWNYSSPYEFQKYVHTLEMLPTEAPKSALEIGCAEGIFTVMLAEKVEHLTALDISDVALDRCRTRCADFSHIDFLQHDISDGPPSGPYELIVCSEILYYLKDQNALRNFARKISVALQDGGHILMTHSNMVADDRSHTGFDFNEIGALYISQIFSEIAELEFVRELRTELYRVQLFCKSTPIDAMTFEHDSACVPREVICRAHAPFDHPSIKWGGCAVTAAEAKHCLASPRIPILMYHRVAADGPAELAPYRISPESFERQLAYLQRQGYRGLSMDEFYYTWFTQTESEIPGRPIVLTFDDAYLDFYDIAWPLLRKFGFGATVFVPVDFVGASAEWDSDAGEPARLMDWHQLHDLNANGIDIGAHSCAHVRPGQMTPDDFSDDTRRSKKVLEAQFGSEISGYCYPFAAAEIVHRDIVKEAGFKYAVGGTGGDPDDRKDSFYIPRIEIFGTDSMTDFIAKLPKSELANPDRREAYEELRLRRDRATYMGD